MSRAHTGDCSQDGWHTLSVAYATVGSRLAKKNAPSATMEEPAVSG